MNRKRLIRSIVGFFVFQILIVIYTLLLPREYMSYATLLAPESESPGVVLNTPYGQLQNPELSPEAVSSQAIIALLESRRLARKVLKTFNLFNEYKTDNEDIALKKFNKNLDVSLDPEKGIITLSFISQNPVLARDVVLFMLNQLDSLNLKLKLTPRKPLAKVIDFPDIPRRKYRPHLSHNIIIGSFLYLSLIILYLAFNEILKGLKVE